MLKKCQKDVSKIQFNDKKKVKKDRPQNVKIKNLMPNNNIINSY